MENDRVDGAVWIRTRTHEEKRFVRRHRSPNASDLFSIADSSLLKQMSRLHFAVAPSRGYRLRQRRRVSNIPPVRVHPMPGRIASQVGQREEASDSRVGASGPEDVRPRGACDASTAPMPSWESFRRPGRGDRGKRGGKRHGGPTIRDWRKPRGKGRRGHGVKWGRHGTIGGATCRRQKQTSALRTAEQSACINEVGIASSLRALLRACISGT